MKFIKKNINNKIIVNGYALDKEQTKAVTCNNNQILVIAGAGSGKTLTIVGKVKYLIEKELIDKNKILCISFTNETVNSLKESLNKEGYLVDVKTFHKFSLDILSNNNYKVASSNLLEYIIEEYFYSFIYFDNTYKLLNKYLEINNLSYNEFINNFKKTTESFIKCFKACNYKIDYFLDILFDKKSVREEKYLLVIIFKIFILYEEELKSQNMIDFDDMITCAKEEILKKRYFKYKYIIIDEYQDTSFSRYELIKSITEKFNVRIMAVGDDYQSIYAFNGCSIKLFTEFNKYFKNSSIIKIKNTYRNTKDIVDISKRFVQKNKQQIRKNLKSKKYLKDSITVVYSYNQLESFIKIIEPLDNILVLGRNNKDINLIIDNINFKLEKDRVIYLKDESKNIKFLTVHKSKGLEEKNIIILNVIDDILGFPNKIKEDSLIRYLKKKEDNFLYSEERRLFYVALTRAKEKVFILTNKSNPSIFVKELVSNYRLKIKVIEFD